MKKALCSTAAAALLVFALSGCADTPPVQTGGHSPQPITLAPSAEPTGSVESEPVPFSASNKLSLDTDPKRPEASAEVTPSPEPGPTVEPSAAPAPQRTQAPPARPSTTPAPQETPEPAPQDTPEPAKGTIQFNVTTQKGTGGTPSPEPSATPKPEPTPTPTPAPAPPVESTAPAFNINNWISYAQSYARGAGLNLDPTACWDNPIVAGTHSTCLERDLQSRLNRYAKDESISDVWVWAEPRTDGSYDLYIGYA